MDEVKAFQCPYCCKGMARVASPLVLYFAHCSFVHPVLISDTLRLLACFLYLSILIGILEFLLCRI